MNLEKTNLNDTIISGDRLFHIEIEGWECDLGFCINKDKEDNIIYVVINKDVPKDMMSIVIDTACNLIRYSEIYSKYNVMFYLDEDFKITKLNE